MGCFCFAINLTLPYISTLSLFFPIVIAFISSITFSFFTALPNWKGGCAKTQRIVKEKKKEYALVFSAVLARCLVFVDHSEKKKKLRIYEKKSFIFSSVSWIIWVFDARTILDSQHESADVCHTGSCIWLIFSYLVWRACWNHLVSLFRISFFFRANQGWPHGLHLLYFILYLALLFSLRYFSFFSLSNYSIWMLYSSFSMAFRGRTEAEPGDALLRSFFV